MDDEKKLLINQLIVEVSKLDEEALQQLFDITKDELYHLTMEYLNDKETRDRVLSLTYLKVVRRAKYFNSQTSDGFDWICQILKEISSRYQKKSFNAQEKKITNAKK
ncbi:MAG: hypothetical protein K2K48_03545 [Anaeroplasmataceae bacterium]|nr:hypothetical protein [Anaeroplasmataceae bacterium]MDE6414466.1 hypothetical protein [Anaeroplasmataceae bacterium]